MHEQRQSAQPSFLRGYRAACGLSQDDLAQLAGLSRETISRIERGDTPRWKTARTLAAALGVRPEQLFPLNDEDPAGKPGLVTTPARQGRHEES